MSAFEDDSNGLLSEVERVCPASNMEMYVNVQCLAERTRALRGRTSK